MKHDSLPQRRETLRSIQTSRTHRTYEYLSILLALHIPCLVQALLCVAAVFDLPRYLPIIAHLAGVKSGLEALWEQLDNHQNH